MWVLPLGFPDSSVGKEPACIAGDPRFDSWVGKIPWRKDRLPTPVLLGFPCGSAGEVSACNAGDLGLISGLGRSPGEGKGYSLHHSGIENSINCIAHGVAKSQTQLRGFHSQSLFLLFHHPFSTKQQEKPFLKSTNQKVLFSSLYLPMVHCFYNKIQTFPTRYT